MIEMLQAISADGRKKTAVDVRDMKCDTDAYVRQSLQNVNKGTAKIRLL